ADEDTLDTLQNTYRCCYVGCPAGSGFTIHSRRERAGSGAFGCDGDGNAARDDVEHGGAFARLRDEIAELLGRRVGVDVEGDADVLVAVAHLVGDAEDAAQVDV